MGLFGSTKDNGMGYASVENKQNFTNEDLLAKLSEIKVSFGTPIMGDIKGTQSILYKNVSDMFDVFARVDGKKIIMGKIGTDGVSGGKMALSAGLDLFLGHKDSGTSTVDRAVTELSGVITKLENGDSVTASAAAGPAKTSTGAAITLYMKQKAISLKPKFDIFDRDEKTAYHVEGDIARLNFSIQKNGSEVLKLKKKLLALMPEYSIEKNGSQIAKIKKKLKFSAPELVGEVNGKELKISGDLMGFDFDLQIGGNTIGHVDTDRTIWSDCYRIAILDEALQDVVAALAIICDNVVNQEQSR
ncbi:MAG: LURP-one-related family protein [Lachnospiraceae bacterium]|nr:LURP-one-related family protein [Lachnospiraceae bacterium]